jgi:hypothetical protein
MTQVAERAAIDRAPASMIAGAIPLIDVTDISPATPRPAARQPGNYAGPSKMSAFTTWPATAYFNR